MLLVTYYMFVFFSLYSFIPVLPDNHNIWLLPTIEHIVQMEYVHWIFVVFLEETLTVTKIPNCRHFCKYRCYRSV